MHGEQWERKSRKSRAVGYVGTQFPPTVNPACWYKQRRACPYEVEIGGSLESRPYLGVEDDMILTMNLLKLTIIEKAPSTKLGP
jgi:hypothetical protein